MLEFLTFSLFWKTFPLYLTLNTQKVMGNYYQVQAKPTSLTDIQPRETKLEVRVAKFISLICNVSMMKQQMIEIGLPLSITSHHCKCIRLLFVQTLQLLQITNSMSCHPVECLNCKISYANHLMIFTLFIIFFSMIYCTD